MAFVLQLP